MLPGRVDLTFLKTVQRYLITTPNQLVAAALVLQEWVPRTRVNPGVWIAIFLVAIISINYFGIRFFGEFEFWLSSFKVLVILGLIVLSVILAAGGGPTHDVKGSRYWQNPGAFKPYSGITNDSTAKFVSFWSAMVNATFAYLGTELIGVTVGEAQNPRRTIPRAIKLTFYRILLFYVVSVLLLGMLVPYNSKNLIFANAATTGAAASPFVVAIEEAGIPVLGGILNACILLFVLSAANSDLYIATRTLFGLAKEGKAPGIFSRTNRRGVPIYALVFGALFCCLGFMSVSDDSKTVFSYFVNLVTVFGLLTWLSILYTHIRFVAAREAQNISDSELAYTAPFGTAGSWVALAFTLLITIVKNFTVFIPDKSYGSFDWRNFITGYLGIPLYIIMFFGYKVMKRSKWIKSEDADLFSGKQQIDDEEMEFISKEKARLRDKKEQGGFTWIYERFLGWVF